MKITKEKITKKKIIMNWKTLIEFVAGVTEQQIDSERNPDKYKNGTVLEFIFSVGFLILGFFLFDECDGIITSILGIASLLIGFIGIVTAIGIKGLLMSIVGIVLIIAIAGFFEYLVVGFLLLLCVLIISPIFMMLIKEVSEMFGVELSWPAKILIYIIFIIIVVLWNIRKF